MFSVCSCMYEKIMGIYGNFPIQHEYTTYSSCNIYTYNLSEILLVYDQSTLQ